MSHIDESIYWKSIITFGEEHGMKIRLILLLIIALFLLAFIGTTSFLFQFISLSINKSAEVVTSANDPSPYYSAIFTGFYTIISILSAMGTCAAAYLTYVLINRQMLEEHKNQERYEKTYSSNEGRDAKAELFQIQLKLSNLIDDFEFMKDNDNWSDPEKKGIPSLSKSIECLTDKQHNLITGFDEFISQDNWIIAHQFFSIAEKIHTEIQILKIASLSYSKKSNEMLSILAKGAPLNVILKYIHLAASAMGYMQRNEFEIGERNDITPRLIACVNEKIAMLQDIENSIIGWSRD